MNLFDLHSAMMPMLAAAKMPLETMIMVAVGATIVITVFTVANWRLGVKIAFVMVLFEGAIRKWLMPGAQELAYFTKDVFLIGSYFSFFFMPDPQVRAWKLRAPVGLVAFCCILLSFSTLNPNIGSPVLALYGLKIYIFYIPLAFMLPYLFRTREEMENNLFWYLMLALPICLLGVVQFAAPGWSALNVQAHGGEGTTFGWADARVRVTGTFSYMTGHTTFVVVFFTLHLAMLLNKMQKWKWMALACNMPLIMANALMSGSRSAIFGFAMVVIGICAVALFQKVGTGNNAIITIGGGLGVVMLVVSLLFTEARDQWLMRARGSGDSIKYRLVDMQAGSVGAALKDGGIFGLGIGMSHPAVERLRNVLRAKRPDKMAPVFDTEVGQTLVELGFLGWVSWYFMRLMMLAQTWSHFARSPPGILKSLILASFFIQLPHMLLSIVLNHTANFLVFASFGLALIATLHPAVARNSLAGQPSAPFGLPAGQDRAFLPSARRRSS